MTPPPASAPPATPPSDPLDPGAGRRFTLDELCTLADVPRRTVRYYIQIGLLDRPQGETRAAHYLSLHLDRLLRIRQLADAGVSLERIREVLSGAPPTVPTRPRGPGTVEVWSHLVLADGLEVQIEPGRAGLAPEEVRALFAEFSAAYARIRDAGTAGG
ncbi:MAG: helix-turn-helix domain-containing protein [Burkholderiales bacterium]|nr:helix-turn-helix domain-containing protein [Burkholderiales bacterium]